MMRPVAALLALAACIPWVTAEEPNNFYGDPPDETHPWYVHDMRRPQPKVVTPATPSTQEQPGKPPSDAIVLFDGTVESLKANWEADKPGNIETKWEVKDGAMECRPGSGYVRTKQKFGDIQLHVEWAAPKEVKGSSQGRGNSGIFLMGDFECQVLDNFDNPSYPDGMAGSIYGINPPMANALRPPGQYQFVDIVFRRPIHKDGKELDPGHMTVFINGVLMQDATPFEGPGGHMRRSKSRPFPETGHLKFQDHGNPVRFRNVWLRPLPPRNLEGGDIGAMSPEACMAKRKETAAKVRDEAAKEKDPIQKLRLTLESITYEKEAGAVAQATQMATAYVDGIKALSGDALDKKKDEVKRMNGVFQYMVRHNILPDFAPKKALEEIVKAKGWDKK